MPETAKDKLRRWLSGHRDLLVAFDSDEDTRIDERELGNALTLAVQWGEKARTTPNARWFVASGTNAVGPNSWRELEEQFPSQPELLISLEGTDFWLPFAAVDLGRQV